MRKEGFLIGRHQNIDGPQKTFYRLRFEIGSGGMKKLRRNMGVRVSENSAEIWNSKQKLVFMRDHVDDEFNFKTFVWDGTQWRLFFDGENYIADGTNFNLKPSSCRVLKNARNQVTLRLAGKKENALSTRDSKFNYRWNTLVEAFSKLPWMKITTVIHLPKDLKLTEPEPLLLLKFKGASEDEVQLESTGSNDMPSVYYWTGMKKGEALFFFDMTPMKWMSKQNMRRFKDYRCSSKIEEKNGQKETIIGLLGVSKTGNVIRRGDIVLSHWLLENYRSRKPSKWKALNFMIKNSLDLLVSNVEKPLGATSWKKFAEGCVKDLMKEYYCWINLNGIVGYRAYVAETCFEFGGKRATVDSLEYITQTDVIWPWLLYLRIKPNEEHEEHIKKVMNHLPSWHDPKRHIIYNGFHGKFAENGMKVAPEKVGDSWYFFENGLIKTAWIAYLSEDQRLQEIFLDACLAAVKYAHNVDYDFPVFYYTDTLMPFTEKGLSFEYGAAGLYAYAMILAHKFSPEKKYLEESVKALKKMHSHDVNDLCYEPQFFSFAALAAFHLYRLFHEQTYLNYAKDFLNAELKMMYWYDDKTEPLMAHYDTKGLFRACPPYPAFKENVEAVLPWTTIFAQCLPNDGFLKVLNLARTNNFYHFSPCLPRNIQPASDSPCKYIPYENLHMLEEDWPLGWIGKEIYGAGETLWMYLMFEALGHASDWDVLTLNMDLLDLDRMMQFPYFERRFILYNPKENWKKFDFQINALSPSFYNVVLQGRDKDVIDEKRIKVDYDSLYLKINLKPKSFIYCTVRKHQG